jgi:hypothetical protein
MWYHQWTIGGRKTRQISFVQDQAKIMITFGKTQRMAIDSHLWLCDFAKDFSNVIEYAPQGNLEEAMELYRTVVEEDPQDYRPYLCQV